MYRLAIYGKGGVGKSTVSANLSYLLSCGGSTVLHVGCDPKHDSTRLLTGGECIRTFASDTSADPVVLGDNGIMCVECGGAEPGRGCAGKGMELLFSRIAGVDADYRVCDVLGDVVCGGFSLPARKANADAVVIVTSGEFMSLFAANNILKGLVNINDRPCVMGVVLNRRGVEREEESVRAFADAAGLPVICDLPRSRLFRDAEAAGEVLSKLRPESEEAGRLRGLAEYIRSRPRCHMPRPLSDGAMTDLAVGRPVRREEAERRRRSCSFGSFDSERNLSYRDDFVMPACTSHGAAESAMMVTDAAVVLHGPSNCAYLMEFAYRRRTLFGTGDRRGCCPEPGIYSTALDGAEVFRDTGEAVERAVRSAVADGYRTVFLVPTCTSEIMGADIPLLAARASEAVGADVIPVAADEEFLSSKFGGTYGMFDALISRMGPRPVEEGTVNLVSRWFLGLGRDEPTRAVADLLGLLGLRVRFRMMDFCTMAQVEDFCAAEIDIQIGGGMLMDRVCDRLAERTGRPRAIQLDTPTGLSECLEWLRAIAERVPRLAERLPGAEEALRGEYEAGMAEVRPRTEGLRVAVFGFMPRGPGWQFEALEAMGAEVVCVLISEGPIIDHNMPRPDFGDVPVVEDARMCDLRRVVREMGVDLVVTNNSDRVGREGIPWAPMGARDIGLRGAVEWARQVADAVNLPANAWEAGL